MSAGSLPTGLSLNASSGAIAGTSSAVGTYNFTITATDTVTSTAAQAYSIVVNPTITVNPASLPATTAGIAYSQSVSTTGGTGAMTYSVSAGSLPAGLSLSAATGAITGTPSASGTFNFTITATDTVGATGSRAYTLTVNGSLAVTPASLPAATIGSAYSQSVTSTGGTGTVTLSLSAGSLPAGLSFNAATGAISGTPTASGSFNFTIMATDSLGATGSTAYSFTVNTVTLTVNPVSLPNWTQGVAYSQTITASGGTGSTTYSASGALPIGLSLNSSSGAITGTPSALGTFNFTITVTDSLGSTGARAYGVTINPALSISPVSLPATTQGVAYSQLVTASGGTGAPSYSVSAGALPTGLTLNVASGAITGTSSASGTFNFTIAATDTVGATASHAYSVIVNAPLTVNPASLPAPTVGTAYSQSISVTGGTGASTFAVTAGSFPTGLVLNATTGAITGTPTSAATFNFTITATDTLGATGAHAYSVTVSPAAALSIAPASLPATTRSLVYSQTVIASGGTAPYTYALTIGSLPTGLSLNTSTGAITGTSSVAGSFSFTITATDSFGATGSRAYTVVVNTPVAVNPGSLPATTQGVPYSQSVTSTGGTGAVTFAVTVGSLPTGLSLNAASGAIAGTPSAAGAFNFTVTGTDSLGATGSQAYSIAINAPLTVNPASLPAPTVGTAYSQSVSVTGGTGASTFAVTAGSLPTGLSLNTTTGAIAGTPTSAATFNFTITATDTVSATGSRAYSVTVSSPAALSIAPASLPATTQGLAYNQTVTASGGTAPYTYAVQSAACQPACRSTRQRVRSPARRQRRAASTSRSLRPTA